MATPEHCEKKETILLLGGWNNDSLLMVDSNGQNWIPLNIKLPHRISDHGAQFLNNSLYIFGGTIESSTYKLSKSLQWERMADMNRKRNLISNSSVILNNQIWVCGGANGNERLKSVEMYDPETNIWKYMKEMNTGRSSAAAAVVKGKIFCSGGWNGDSLDSVECYDPSSDVWTLICNMPKMIWGHGAAEIDGNLIVMGGWINEIGDSSHVWSFHTTDENAVWVEKPSMAIPRKDFSIAKIDDKVFICGGQTPRARVIDAVGILDGEAWNNGPKMPICRYRAPAVVVSMEFIKYIR